MKRIAVLAAKRTPIGAFQGQFSSLSAPQLGAIALKAVATESGVDGKQIDEVIMGNVIGAGIGQAPARQAMIGAGLPNSIVCSTLNKVCGSGMQAIVSACDSIHAGNADLVLAGGMESMTNAPYLLTKARLGMRMGHHQTFDAMILDGLWDPYGEKHMGVLGELCAEKYDFSREAQDAFSIESLRRVKIAIEQGVFRDEIIPVSLQTKKGEVICAMDEPPDLVKMEKIPLLKAAFKENGTITAANASSISDGAAALILASEEKARQLGIMPVAWLTAHSSFSHAPEWFTTAPIGAVTKLLSKRNWGVSDVDLWEINEAFAVVTMAAMKELNIDHEKVNVHGGATALGHPIGCTGARIVVTLINALKKREKTTGVATLCIGGGEAIAVSVEIPTS